MRRIPGEKKFYPQLYSADRFAERLEQTFGSEYRIRWSVREGCWHLEQYLGPRAFKWNKHRPIDPWYDELVRARDGYSLAMQIRPGNRMPCPRCDLTLDVPVRDTREVRCPNCIRNGHDGKYKAAYFPLDEMLLDYIKARTPSYSGAHVATSVAAADGQNDRRAADLERQVDHGRDALKDAFLDQFPVAGFPSLTLDSWRH